MAGRAGPGRGGDVRRRASRSAAGVAVGARDPEHVEADVLAVIGAGHRLVLPVHADVAVEHEARADRPGVSRVPPRRCACLPGCPRRSRATAEVVAMTSASSMLNLAQIWWEGERWKLSLVSMLSRSFLTVRACTKSSARRLPLRSGRVRRGIEIERPAPSGADQVRRDGVVREPLAPHAARIARDGVVEAEGGVDPGTPR